MNENSENPGLSLRLKQLWEDASPKRKAVYCIGIVWVAAVLLTWLTEGMAGGLTVLLVPLVLFGLFWILFAFIVHKFFLRRDIVECQGCGGLFTHGQFWDNNFACPRCGSVVDPRPTGERKSIL